MKYEHTGKAQAILFIIIFILLSFNFTQGQTRSLNLNWSPREDLNILLPVSVRIYETNSFLHDSAKVRAMYATIDLRDKNLKLRAVGSNSIRETTLETYNRYHGILAINGGYFSSNKSESLLVSDGELVAPGPDNFTRGAFGLVNRKPQIVWPHTVDSLAKIFSLTNPVEVQKNQKDFFHASKAQPWYPGQAVGGGPVLIKNGKIRDTSNEEGFGASHLKRHPRTAIGFRDEHTLVMMVVDGRQDASAGVTIKELVQIMFEAGCYEAVNLDGGGSSAMVAADEVVNVPVDIPNGNRHSLRRNASALVLTEEVPSTKRKTLFIDTDSELYEEIGIWKNSNQVNYYGDTPAREASSNSLNKAVFYFKDIKADSFQLAAWWTVSSNNTHHAKYILHHNQRTDTIDVDQSSYSNNGRWNILGNYFLTSKDYVEILSTEEDKRLLVDAIRLVDIQELDGHPKRGDLRIAVISDLNSALGSATYEWQVDSIIQRMPRVWSPDLVLCGGDMVAGMGISDTATLTKMWHGFNQHIFDPLKKNKIPFGFTIGNHDGLRSYPEERKAISKYWADPTHDTGLKFVDKSHFPHYYSFQAGEVFFVSWDASSSDISDDNLEWLKEQFERAEAKNSRFRFVIGHLPIYSVAQERDSRGNLLENGEDLRKLLEKYNVKVYISGHQHAYYPGKRGKLQLLNCGAAGSGPRRWLTMDKEPVNTITIMDVFYEKDTITYTTYDIKHREADKMAEFNYHELPSSISGVNGFLIRNDIADSSTSIGKLYSLDPNENEGKSFGDVKALIDKNKKTVTITGTFNSDIKLIKGDDAITLCLGKHTENGIAVINLSEKSKNQKSGTFSKSFDLSEEITEGLSAGMYHVLIKTEKFPKGQFRAQLYPSFNKAPQKPFITSYQKRHIYGIRNIKGLYRIEWTNVRDDDGDNVSYVYQMASDSLFEDIVLNERTERINFIKKNEEEFYKLLRNANERTPITFYHRVIATDGLNFSESKTSAIRLMRRNEPLTDFIEVDPEPYVFDGKIENASGQGAGALWDKTGKLWLADYGGTLYAKLQNDTDASFSPLRSVVINNKSYSLKPINGIGLDLDGNLLIGSNRYLFKINSQTGEGIAVWEAPEGKRAITSPRVNQKGEIYAMSLFAEDPNYILKQSTSTPGTFELVRTITLPQRILARTFDMTSDGLTLYFPDPGSPIIQKFTSTDGVTYKRTEDITSTAAGCNALTVVNDQIFTAVRPSGISDATLHFRNEQKKLMWTLPLPELSGAEARGLAVSENAETIIICNWDKGGGFVRYRIRK